MSATALLLAAFLVSASGSLVASERPDVRPHDDYLRALAVLARGELAPAAQSLARLETEADASPATVAELRRAQRRMGRTVGRRSVEALLPLALLHRRAFEIHADAGRAPLASAASRRAEELAHAYVRGGGDLALAAALFTSLARSWHSRFEEAAAAPLYRRALELDPQQPAALLGLAVVYEKQGLLREAAAALDGVLSLAPEDRETKLRRALVRARLGDAATALVALEQLAREPGDDWIASLVHQERARLLAVSGRIAEAFDAAREGHSRLRCDPTLALLEAYYGERAGALAGDLVPALLPCSGTSDTSPRRSYNQQPRRLLELAERRLEQAERDRLPALAGALGSRASE